MTTKEDRAREMLKVRKAALKSFCKKRKLLAIGNSEDYVVAYMNGYESRESELSQLKEATRWREVEKELPEEGSVIIACCMPFDFQEAIMMILESDYDFGVLTSYYTHWRPIE